jgi:hypothetical protein
MILPFMHTPPGTSIFPSRNRIWLVSSVANALVSSPDKPIIPAGLYCAFQSMTNHCSGVKVCAVHEVPVNDTGSFFWPPHFNIRGWIISNHFFLQQMIIKLFYHHHMMLYGLLFSSLFPVFPARTPNIRLD